MQLLQTENNLDYKTYELCNDDGDKVVYFDVEIKKETALISYYTEYEFRNKGYASLGLNLLKNVLFSDFNILFLELINLSNDYSRKVAENAGFFSPINSINYYISLNPNAETIIEEQIQKLEPSSKEYKKRKNLYNKIKRLRACENHSKEELKRKLKQLLQEQAIDLESGYQGYYKKNIKDEINHLQNILGKSQDNINKKR